MTDQTSMPDNIRSDMVEIAAGFLQNPKIASEDMERKRVFLQKKGLTDTEINHAFQRLPSQETIEQSNPKQPSSYLYRFVKDVAIAGLLVFLIQLIKRSFRSNQPNELQETIKSLQKTIEDMQTSVVKLEQASDQLDLKIRTSNAHPSSSVINEIRQEVQLLKETFLNRSQFPAIPSVRPIASRVTNSTLTDSENDGIIIISEHDKKSDDENLPSTDY
ncbi:unnamed protein product [Adineta ricciae]|uniref:Peroxisomal membrane protein PEX14 n=1 Tax=Adineta ricciae TaxID=249248 RepID=A0A815A2E4_ADIRI|nr:unnamed protein product [Adineta ricciae]CAF1251089.1 unnamed protein product [Adineta ricciae]